MTVLLTAEAQEDYGYWQAHDPRMLLRIEALMADALRRRAGTMGKPAPLKGALAGWWSRRIAGEHRLIYRLEGSAGREPRLIVAACRYHYGE